MGNVFGHVVSFIFRVHRDNCGIFLFALHKTSSQKLKIQSDNEENLLLEKKIQNKRKTNRQLKLF
jgi:hypothetical protein